ncbi:MAG: hypothetical protein K2L87_03460, partial [Clostridiales bacterium]|nr:hypothetical protein [Clostridiales bacterium]
TVTYSNGGIATQAEEKNPLIGYNAGTYTMAFAFKPAFNETTNNVVWANGETAAREVTVEVEKLELNVTGWNKDQENSTVRLDSGSVPEDMVEYRFRNEAGDIVTMGEVLTADDDTKFTIELIVKPAYANNVVVNYAHDSIKSYTFTKGQDDNSPEQLVKPSFEKDTLEFSGTEQTFVIRNWSFYELYLEIKDGSDSLAQTEIDDYSVTFVIKEDANAVWLDGSEEVTLNFHITEASAKYLKLSSTSKYVFLYEKEDGNKKVRRAYTQDSLIHGENDLELGFERFVLGQISAGTTIEAFLSNLDQGLLQFIRLYDQTNRLVYDRENGLTASFKNIANKAFFAVGTGWR